jgi:signal transduction histidine kinase
VVARALTNLCPPRLLPFAVGTVVVLGIAFALWAESIRLESHWPIEWVAIDIVPGIAFLLCGFIGTLRRPDTPIGPAMIVAGFAWYSGTAAASQDPVIDRFGNAFQGYYDGILAWLVLAYPTGRLRDRAGRLAVGAIFALLLARTVFRFATFRMSTEYDFSLPSEADRYIADMTLRDAGHGVFTVALAGLMVVVIALLVRRLWSESTAARGVAWPMILAGVALAVAVVVEIGALALAGTSSERFGVWAVADVVNSATNAGVAIAFLVGLLRGRLAKQRVADLVVELSGADDRPGLRDVVARALRDPTAELLYPGPTPDAYIDAAGMARSARDVDGRAVTRIDAGGETLAVLVHDSALAEQPELLRSVIAAVRLAIENERLAAEVRAQLGEVRASRARIVAAGDEQRRRIERDLHDGAQQRLVTVALRLELARAAARRDGAGLAEALDAAGRDLDGAIAELRDLARGLHPSALSSDGLHAAVRALAERTPLQIDVDVVEGRFDEQVESTAYFIVAEALTNVVRYAQASRATVQVAVHDRVMAVSVSDDGIGGADPSQGSGLRGLEDRAEAMGGRLILDSQPGRGTTVRAELPCA